VPSLRGAYIFGDSSGQRIWAVRNVDTLPPGVPAKELLFRGAPVSSFAEDQDGELYATILFPTATYGAGTILALEENPPTTPVPGEGPPLYYAFYPYPPANVDEDWIRSRALILGDLEDVRVVWTGEPRLLLRGTDYPGAPDLEEVAVEVDHIGSFDGEHRAFCDTRVHRVWSVQRRNAGPWRVASFQGI